MITTLILVALIIVVALIVFMWDREPEEDLLVPPNNDTDLTPTPVLTPTPDVDDVENFVRYQDEVIGFSFEYPEAMEVQIEREIPGQVVELHIEVTADLDISQERNYVVVTVAPAVGRGMEGYEATDEEEPEHLGVTWLRRDWRSREDTNGFHMAITATTRQQIEGSHYAIEAFFDEEYEQLGRRIFERIFETFEVGEE